MYKQHVQINGMIIVLCAYICLFKSQHPTILLCLQSHRCCDCAFAIAFALRSYFTRLCADAIASHRTRGRTPRNGCGIAIACLCFRKNEHPPYLQPLATHHNICNPFQNLHKLTYVSQRGLSMYWYVRTYVTRGVRNRPAIHPPPPPPLEVALVELQDLHVRVR